MSFSRAPNHRVEEPTSDLIPEKKHNQDHHQKGFTMFARLSSLVLVAASLQATTSFATEKAVIACADTQTTDGQIAVTYFQDADSGAYRATLMQGSFIHASTHELPLCRVSGAQGGFDVPSTLTCHDSNWTNTYDVAVEVGGLAGIGDVTISYRVGGDTTILATIACHFVDPDAPAHADDDVQVLNPQDGLNTVPSNTTEDWLLPEPVQGLNPEF